MYVRIIHPSKGKAMAPRIDIFKPRRSQYKVQHYLIEKIYEAFERAGADCRLLTIEKKRVIKFVMQIVGRSPHFTFSINGPVPGKNGQSLCDKIGIPHVAYLIDSSVMFPDWTLSPLTIIASVDRDACRFFQEMGA